MKKYVGELIATFFMIFCGTGAMVINTEMTGAISHFGVATAWGLIVMIMIFAYGRISGAHMNPAVTITLVMLKLHPKKELLPYLGVQAIGAFLASFTLKFLFPENELLGASMPSGSEMQSLILEFILTFLLMIVILLTSQGRRIEQYYAPIAIGMTVGLEALFAGPISNASMNPIRSIAPALVSGHTEHLWLYLVATPLGAISAGLYWKWQSSFEAKND
ncbi:aquaporin [Crocinitomicaceae bacterium]|nr:aquaporin [Crocinitomicaceae bacterium]|tara:strand:+ start:4290 stop:4946 length:657 start_codon:yes stop_codon:yes gene_type:complete